MKKIAMWAVASVAAVLVALAIINRAKVYFPVIKTVIAE